MVLSAPATAMQRCDLAQPSMAHAAACVVVTRRLPAAALQPLARRPNTVLSVWDSEEPMPRQELLRALRADGGASGVGVCPRARPRRVMTQDSSACPIRARAVLCVCGALCACNFGQVLCTLSDRVDGEAVACAGPALRTISTMYGGEGGGAREVGRGKWGHP